MYGTCMEINDKSMEIDEICSKWEMIHTGNEWEIDGTCYNVQSCSNMFKLVKIFRLSKTIKGYKKVHSAQRFTVNHCNWMNRRSGCWSSFLHSHKLGWLMVHSWTWTIFYTLQHVFLDRLDMNIVCIMYIYVYSLYVPCVVIKKGSVKVLIQVLSPVEQFICRCWCLQVWPFGTWPLNI